MTERLTSKDIENLLREELGITSKTDLIAHVNMNALGPVNGGPEAVAAAILAAAGTVLMPAFTYQTQITPQVGPPDNAMEYGQGDAMNARAEIFRSDMSVHPDIGSVAEAFRKDNETYRSTHPILSFIAQGPDARLALGAQTRENPLAPIAWLEARDGAVLLMGLDQRHNFSLHLAEQRAHRKTFIRWALTIDDIEELKNIPGCMEGFNDIWREMASFTTSTYIGLARCELIPIQPMLELAEKRIRAQPDFMLCSKTSCRECRIREQQIT